MAEIKIQPKGPTIWPWIVGVLAVALLWGFVVWDTDDERVDERVQSAPAEDRVAVPTTGATEVIPIVAILTRPADYVNQTVSGTSHVAEVISDRGFWIEQQGRRMFAVIEEIPREIVHINAGQTVRLTGTVYTPETTKQIEGSLEPDTRRVVESQPAFLYMKGTDVSIIDRGPGGR